MDRFALLWLLPPEVLCDCHFCLLPQTMAMVESIWPSEQLAMALTTPVDPSNLDPADPQVGTCPCLAQERHIHSRKRDKQQTMVLLVATYIKHPVY